MVKRAIPLLLVFLGIAFTAPAQGQALSLLCAWPNNPCCDTIFDINLATGRVTWYPTALPSHILGPGTAQITDQRISWSWRFPNNRFGADNFVIDRIRGIVTVCGPDDASGKFECMDPQPCQPASAVKPKF